MSVPGCYIPVVCSSSSAPEYCQLYSQVSQTLAASAGLNLAGGNVLFEKTVISSANIDVSKAATTGAITVNKTGWYKFNKSANGTLNPVVTPLNAWGLALFINGVIQPGTSLCDMTLSPEQLDNLVTGSFLVHCKAGDVMTYCNMCSGPLILSNVHPGINCAVNSAMLNIQSVDFI
jgi:hypothetical protein